MGHMRLAAPWGVCRDGSASSFSAGCLAALVQRRCSAASIEEGFPGPVAPRPRGGVPQRRSTRPGPPPTDRRAGLARLLLVRLRTRSAAVVGCRVALVLPAPQALPRLDMKLRHGSCGPRRVVAPRGRGGCVSTLVIVGCGGGVGSAQLLSKQCMAKR